jgi:hypothetical protein
LLRKALDAAGHGGTPIRMTEVLTDAQAVARGFKGSPTILIGGVDLMTLAGAEDPQPAEPAALSCRVYRRRDGRISATPDPEDVRLALRRVTLAEGVR